MERYSMKDLIGHLDVLQGKVDQDDLIGKDVYYGVFPATVLESANNDERIGKIVSVDEAGFTFYPFGIETIDGSVEPHCYVILKKESVL